MPTFQAGDYAGSLLAVIGVQAALVQRAQTGLGCQIDIAMYEALFNLCKVALTPA
jgi:crotonobetainyl-CoA:carnitine CoA-transferase CaiB-like acyl-CoA transferase